MKKLSKLQINPENLIKGEELQKLRGGWQDQCAVFSNGEYQGNRDWYCYGENCAYQWYVDQSCAAYYSQYYENCTCFCNIGY